MSAEHMIVASVSFVFFTRKGAEELLAKAPKRLREKLAEAEPFPHGDEIYVDFGEVTVPEEAWLHKMRHAISVHSAQFWQLA